MKPEVCGEQRKEKKKRKKKKEEESRRGKKDSNVRDVGVERRTKKNNQIGRKRM
jgi:hypothetical protein